MSSDDGPVRVVVVEDSEAFLMRLRLALDESPELQVVGVAESAGQAISLLDRTRPDLVLLDLCLKEGNGVDVLRHIRETGLRVRTLVMTSSDSGELQSACLSLGAHRFFDKVGLISALSDETDTLIRELSGS